MTPLNPFFKQIEQKIKKYAYLFFFNYLRLPFRFIHRHFGWALKYLTPLTPVFEFIEIWTIEKILIPAIRWFRSLTWKGRLYLFIVLFFIWHMYAAPEWWIYKYNVFLSWTKGDFLMVPIVVDFFLQKVEKILLIIEVRNYMDIDNSFRVFVSISCFILPYISYRIAWYNALWITKKGADMVNCRPYGSTFFEEVTETSYERLFIMVLFWIQQNAFIAYLWTYMFGASFLYYSNIAREGGKMRFSVWRALNRDIDFVFWTMNTAYYDYFFKKRCLNLPYKGYFMYSQPLWGDGVAWVVPNRTYFKFGRKYSYREAEQAHEFFMPDHLYGTISNLGWYKARMNSPYNLFGKTINNLPFRERNLQNSFIAPWHSWLWHRLDRTGIDSTRKQSIPHVIESHSTFRLTCFKYNIPLDYSGWTSEESLKRALLDENSWFYFWRKWYTSVYISTCYQEKVDPFLIAWLIASPVRRHGFYGHANPHSWIPTMPVTSYDLRIMLVSPCFPLHDVVTDTAFLCAR